MTGALGLPEGNPVPTRVGRDSVLAAEFPLGQLASVFRLPPILAVPCDSAPVSSRELWREASLCWRPISQTLHPAPATAEFGGARASVTLLAPGVCSRERNRSKSLLQRFCRRQAGRSVNAAHSHGGPAAPELAAARPGKGLHVLRLGDRQSRSAPFLRRSICGDSGRLVGESARGRSRGCGAGYQP